MPTRKLSAAGIAHLAEGEWWDTILPGLILRVGKRRRSWSVRYRAGGCYHRKPLGHFPHLELGAARDAARALIDRVDRGMPAEPPAPHPRSALTLGGLLDKYEALRIREGKRTKVLPEAMRLLRRELAPYLSQPAGQFAKADLRAARDAMVERDAVIAANRMLGYLGPMLRWAAQEDLVSVNFVPAIRRAPELKRDRVLTRAEIKAIWNACGELGSYGRMVKFLLLTAQRRGEAVNLRHGDIIDNRWKQLENKAGRPHTLILPPLALALVGQGAARDYVFAGLTSGKMAGFVRAKAALDKASSVTRWRIHDLRRSAATNLQELKVRNEVVQSILNHAVPGVGGIYLRAELEREKAEALALWAGELEKIIGPLRVTACPR